MRMQTNWRGRNSRNRETGQGPSWPQKNRCHSSVSRASRATGPGRFRVAAGRRAIPVLAALLLPFLAACDGGSRKDRITITHFPDWYTPELRRVAVIPFADRTRTGAGGRLSDKISAALTANRTYEVYTRQNLRDVVAEKDLVDAGILEADQAMEIGRLKAVQAVICGVCNRYEAATQNEIRYQQVPIWGQDVNGNPIITGYNQVPYQHTRHDAWVDCQVVVIDTQTGRQLAAFSDPTNLWAEGSPPKVGPRELLVGAEETQVARIVHAIAVTRYEIKVKGWVLKTAVEMYDGKWKFATRYAADAGKFYAVVRLPSQGDRNAFRLTVVTRDGRTPVAEMPFTWDKTQHSSEHGTGFELDTRALYEQGGAGKYEVKLYSGRDPEPIAKCPFTIEPVKGEKSRKGKKPPRTDEDA